MNRNTPFTFPGPKPAPVVGNIPDLDTHAPIQSLIALAKEYGPIFRLEFPGREMIVVSSQELVNGLCDEQRFDKQIHAALQQVRDFGGDGLFTAATQSPDWGKAHRILMPVFGPSALRGMFPGMLDIAEQLLMKWERQGPTQRIDVVDNMTRLTLDTIALCAFDYRFNSFYAQEMHPFVGAMVRALAESGARTRRLPLQNRLMLMTKRQYDEDVRLMRQIADELISDRKKHGDPGGKPDILSTMLSAIDAQTGERLSDENVRDQMVTFLIAGHETTSGLLSFTLHALLRHPEIMAKARAEVERVLGNETPRFEHIAQFTYLDQVFKETLRLWPTAPAFALHALAEETTLGAYPIRNDQTLYVLTPMLHRDPQVWGADAETFNPDNFAFENAAKLPPNAWKPFGNGQRSCIGRPFALQEATLLLAMILQRFDLSLVDPDYKLEIKETLTLKPHGLEIYAKRRDNVIVTSGQTSGVAGASQAVVPSGPKASNGIPIQVLFGSNAGSAEAFAQRIATDARMQGYVPSLGPLDSAVDSLSKKGAVVIVTASYEGRPPDNARKFMEWLDALPAESLTSVRYAVFGCGNKDWARTYQAIPKQVDQKLEEASAERLLERGEANARGDFFGDFDRWYEGFWQKIGAVFGQETRAVGPMPLLEVEFVTRAQTVAQRRSEMPLGMIVENRELVNMDAPHARSKRHIEIALPEGMHYRSGDYLAVLPLNPPANVDRALHRFGLGYDAQVQIHLASGGQTFFPTDQPVMVGELLASYVELGAPATRKQIDLLIAATPCPPEKQALTALVAEDAVYESEVLEKRVSVLDLLERTPSCGLSFAAFLQMLSPLKPRQYSISSSPLWSADHCTLTLAVVDAPALSGQGRYYGAASTYLAQSRPGTQIPVSVRPSQVAFHPPTSLETPLIMVCAGTGLAPFHGFLQERAARVAESEGQTAGPALLFFGCTHPDVDFLYRQELTGWEQSGLVSVRPAFSQASVGDVKYVQDRLWQDRADVIALVRQGAVFFVCGDGRRMAPAIHETCMRIYQEAKNATAEEAEQWIDQMERQHGRYVADVFA